MAETQTVRRVPLAPKELGGGRTERLMPSAGYKYQTYPTKAYIEAIGSTLEESLRFAGFGLADMLHSRWSKLNSETRADDKQNTRWLDITLVKEKIRFQGTDETKLLRDWLRKVFLKSELEKTVCADFIIHPIRIENGVLLGEAELSGQRVLKLRERIQGKAKFHGLEIDWKNRRIQTSFFIDL